MRCGSVSEHSEMFPQQFIGRDSLIVGRLGGDPLLRDRLGNKARDQTLEVIRPMMVPLGARQQARVGWWRHRCQKQRTVRHKVSLQLREQRPFILG